MVILLNNNNEEYTPRHANGFNNDLIIDNSLNYNYANNTSNDDDVLDSIINDKKHNKKKKKRKSCLSILLSKRKIPTRFLMKH